MDGWLLLLCRNDSYSAQSERRSSCFCEGQEGVLCVSFAVVGSERYEQGGWLVAAAPTWRRPTEGANIRCKMMRGARYVYPRRSFDGVFLPAVRPPFSAAGTGAAAAAAACAAEERRAHLAVPTPPSNLAQLCPFQREPLSFLAKTSGVFFTFLLVSSSVRT